MSASHHLGFISATLVFLLGLSGSGCVGNSELRRGGPGAAYSGPMVATTGPTAPLGVGRIEVGKDGWRFAWSGTSATVHFRGRAVSADLTDSGKNQFLVLVDGKPVKGKIAPPPGRTTVELVSGLPQGEHTLTLYKLTEPVVGETTLHGFILDNYGESLPTVQPPKRRIEIIGDSISAGYGNEGTDPNCGFTPETQNHFLTYGARAARELDAELTTLAWSGRGVFSNRANPAEPETMSMIWERTLPADPASTWHFDSAPPDVVIINLGTNDFAPEVKDITPFGPAYAALLDKVRQRYPSAHVVATVGPLLNDDYPPGRKSLSTTRTTLQALVTQRGDPKLHYFEHAAVRADEGLGCDYHPTEKTHRRMAAELLGAIRKDVGW